MCLRQRCSGRSRNGHTYDYFGDLVRLGVVKAVNDGGRYPKYAIDIKVMKAKMKEVLGE